MLPAFVEERLVCPETGTPVRAAEGAYVAGNNRYPVSGTCADFFPPRPPAALADRWALWEKLQANGLVSYELAPQLNLSGQGLGDAFGSFLTLDGTILDIGCGPQPTRPRYIAAEAADRYVGVDPLPGIGERRFTFLRAVAESLPFRDGSFDTAVMCSSLDHMIDWRRALAEAVRVVRPGGLIQLALDVVEDDHHVQGRLVDILKRGLRQFVGAIGQMGLIGAVKYVGTIAFRGIPEGAKDHFHVDFPSVEDVQAELQRLGTDVVATRPYEDMLFVAARKT